eukprot:PITA_08002
MVEEYSAIMVNDVWEVVPRPQDRSVVGSRWLYKVKYVADGSVKKYKVRFVAKGYAQKEGIDYEENFAPAARYTSIRSVISLATQMGWKIHQMDVKRAFLNGVIEEVYIEQPEGFETHEKKSHKMEFVKSDTDPNLYYLVVENEPLILVLYVDDLLLRGSQRLQGEPSHRIRREGFGTDAHFLGLEVWQQKGKIFLGQGRYATDILKRQLIGSLMYLVNTRPDICYAVNTLSQFVVEPKRVHWAAAKHVLRYIRGTVKHGLMYTQGNDITLSWFTDAD